MCRPRRRAEGCTGRNFGRPRRSRRWQARPARHTRSGKRYGKPRPATASAEPGGSRPDRTDTTRVAAGPADVQFRRCDPRSRTAPPSTRSRDRRRRSPSRTLAPAPRRTEVSGPVPVSARTSACPAESSSRSSAPAHPAASVPADAVTRAHAVRVPVVATADRHDELLEVGVAHSARRRGTFQPRSGTSQDVRQTAKRPRPQLPVSLLRVTRVSGACRMAAPTCPRSCGRRARCQRRRVRAGQMEAPTRSRRETRPPWRTTTVRSRSSLRRSSER